MYVPVRGYCLQLSAPKGRQYPKGFDDSSVRSQIFISRTVPAFPSSLYIFLSKLLSKLTSCFSFPCQLAMGQRGRVWPILSPK